MRLTAEIALMIVIGIALISSWAVGIYSYGQLDKECNPSRQLEDIYQLLRAVGISLLATPLAILFCQNLYWLLRGRKRDEMIMNMLEERARDLWLKA